MSTQHRLTAGLALAAAAVFAFTACSGGGAAPAETENPAISIAVDPTASMPMIVAEDQGYFADEGLDVTSQRFLAVQGIDAVLGGQMTFASGLDFAALSRLQTGRLKIIAASATPEPGFNKLVVANAIDEPADLAGLKLGTVGGTVQEYITRRFLDDNGVDIDDVEIQRFTDFSEIAAALRAGRIDAGWVRTTDVGEATKDGNTKLLTDDSSVRSNVAIYILAGTDYLEQNPETVKKFLAAVQKGADFVNDDTAAAAEIIAKFADGDPKVLERIAKENHVGLSLTAEQLQGLRDVQDFAVEAGLLEPGDDVESYIDATALRELFPDRVTL